MLPAVTENAGRRTIGSGCSTLIARSRDARVAHHRVDRVIVGQRHVEREPEPSAWTGSLLECGNAVAGEKLIPVPRSLNGMLDAWSKLNVSAIVRPARSRQPCRPP